MNWRIQCHTYILIASQLCYFWRLALLCPATFSTKNASPAYLELRNAVEPVEPSGRSMHTSERAAMNRYSRCIVFSMQRSWRRTRRPFKTIDKSFCVGYLSELMNKPGFVKHPKLWRGLRHCTTGQLHQKAYADDFDGRAGTQASHILHLHCLESGLKLGHQRRRMAVWCVTGGGILPIGWRLLMAESNNSEFPRRETGGKWSA